MTQQLHGRGVLSLRAADTFMTVFQQIFAPFCALMTKLCIFLFFSKLASKFQQLLIADYASETNRIQREFDSNVARATRAAFLASSHLRQKTNYYKLFSSGSLCLRGESQRGVLSLRAADTILPRSKYHRKIAIFSNHPQTLCPSALFFCPCCA
jgi:hypothetical protein